MTRGRLSTDDHPYRSAREPYRVRLPGFITEGQIGLGDVIKRAISAVGIRSCCGCERRAAALNRRLIFYGRRQTV